MAFDGSGNFLRLYNWVTDAANGIDITASRVDGEDSGFAAGLTLCVTRDGQGKMGADFLPSAASTYNLGSAGLPWLNFVSKSAVLGPPATGQAMIINGVSANYAELIQGASAANNSYGLVIQAGTAGGTTDIALNIVDKANSAQYVLVYGNGGMQVGSPTGGNPGLGNINAVGIQIGGNPVYAGIPQNLQTASYTTVLADANKHIAVNANSKIVTIAANSSVAYPIGTAITVLAEPGVTGTQIAINTDTLTWAASGGTGTRNLAAAGIATAIKYAATAWLISGTGLS